MLVVINIDAGDLLNELMAFMTQRSITFSVTDRISKLCDKNVVPEKRESSTQTDHERVARKKARLIDECGAGGGGGSPSSSATSSEGPPETKPQNFTASIVEENADEADDDEASNELIQSQLMQALFSRLKQDPDAIEATDDIDESMADKVSDSPAARYKATYASTKRGVCQVCFREVSLVTTHRRRHAITHLGYKTLKCAVCYKFFSRQDLCNGHFKKDHPDAEIIPFVDTMSKEDEINLNMMLNLCFPKETLKKRCRKPD
ncbi:unnamed protein product [Caenorhabditis bovis]|uniref:C2H2-type domain-containing protein n=1 Tax=Caenorhabditis bovis TaxID=2654633 RepID=A0A8S1EJZ0_9PELO|nr:unnamed protein product [Caenorhabditis bovis]